MPVAQTFGEKALRCKHVFEKAGCLIAGEQPVGKDWQGGLLHARRSRVRCIGKLMFTGTAYIGRLELQLRHGMHNHGFRKILDAIAAGKPSQLQSASGRNRTVSQLTAASAAAVELQNPGVSRFSGTGGYVSNPTRPDTEVPQNACLHDPGPAANTSMTLRQLKQALKTGPSRADLNRLRRRFAMANHPDRACEATRQTLSARLSVANGLIDEALKNTRC